MPDYILYQLKKNFLADMLEMVQAAPQFDPFSKPLRIAPVKPFQR